DVSERALPFVIPLPPIDKSVIHGALIDKYLRVARPASCVKSEKILSGIMTLLVLRRLADKPAHGYGLQSFLSEVLERPIPPGTIYVILSTLRARGLIAIERRATVNGRNVVEYGITDRGTRFLLEHEKPLRTVRKVIGELADSIKHLKNESAA
ncbi:MAG: PadR family transcriptional regulator, partial [Nitrososphaerota archaeon]|nr:PadR family transcriptional regulator [Nitrososphaerota archaeon]